VLPGLTLAAVVAVLVAISVGSVQIGPAAIWSYLSTGNAGDPTWTVLLERIRVPRVATAALAGAGLAVAGLMMQTLFANPLADPYILGVSSGASLGVALVTLGTGTASTTFVAVVGAGRVGVVIAAAAGSAAVLGLILLLGRWVRSIVTLLIVGVMVSSAIGAVVSLLLAFADPARLQRFVVWGLGSFGGVTRSDLVVLGSAIAVGAGAALLLSRSLNALLLGERYARSMGVNVAAVRVIAVVATAVVAGTVTAFCGPIAFLGIAVPHLARLLLGTSDHRLLMPAAILMGVTVSVLCAVVAQLPGSDAVLPINVVSALIGAPVVIAVLLRSRRLAAGAV
jgi:iron complex transport system permease protein